VWNEELSLKIRIPELAVVTLSAFSGDSLLSQFTLPFTAIQQGKKDQRDDKFVLTNRMLPGYRNVPLQNKFSEPLPFASLFVHVVVKDE
jgi:phosphatidylinositol phospholipase C delta